MIGFGELRKLSLQWQIDLAAVERAYAIDWLLKALFDSALAQALIARGSSAMRYAHFADYPFADDPEFLASRTIDAASLTDALGASDLKFSLVDFDRGSAKVEYTGPLGRRSAAQPRITLSFIAGNTRGEPVRAPLIHRFSDPCAALIASVALEELVAERIAVLAASPRVRDVFDLWFITTRAGAPIDLTRVKLLAQDIALSKHIAMPQSDALFNPSHRAILERSWENALRRAPHHPAFAQVEIELAQFLKKIS